MLPGSPTFSDADLRRYLNARAEAVARGAAPADDMAMRVAVDLGLVRRRPSGRARILRLAVVAALLAALAAGALYLVGQLRESYAPDVPEVTTRVHGAPWGVAALDGSIWVAGYREDVLFEIEPATGEVLDEIPIGRFVCGELDAAYGYLWFTSCPPNVFLSRLDPATNRVDRLNGYGSDRLGFGDGLVWLVRDGDLEGLDARSLETIVEFPVTHEGPLTYAFDDIWIADAAGHVLARVDLAEQRIVAEVTWPAPDDGPYPAHLAEADGALWVVDEAALGVFRVDPATNEVTRVAIELAFIDGTGFGDHPIAFGGGELWVRESETSIARIDTETLTVAERIATEAFGGGSFTSTGDALWLANMKEDVIVGLQRP
jgi:streptogramin lyase